MKLLKSRKGSVFITVSMILAILLILMGMLMTISITDMRISQNYSDGIVAYYLAQSGIEKAMAAALAQTTYSNITNDPDSAISFSQYSKPQRVSWSLTWNPTHTTCALTSSASYGNTRKSVRNLNVNITISGGKITAITSWKQTN